MRATVSVSAFVSLRAIKNATLVILISDEAADRAHTMNSILD
jgi:hypothetical protein